MWLVLSALRRPITVLVAVLVPLQAFAAPPTPLRPGAVTR